MPSPLTNKRTKTDLTLAHASELLAYDPETGIFTAKTSATSRRAGQRLGGRLPTGYLVIWIDKRLWLCHRLAWLFLTGQLPNGEIDHINGDVADNRAQNLRLVECRQQQRNMKKWARPTSSRFKGVKFCRQTGRWSSSLKVNRKVMWLGRHPTEEGAALAYDIAARKNFGSLARLNFPGDGEQGALE